MATPVGEKDSLVKTTSFPISSSIKLDTPVRRQLLSFEVDHTGMRVLSIVADLTHEEYKVIQEWIKDSLEMTDDENAKQYNIHFHVHTENDIYCFSYSGDMSRRDLKKLYRDIRRSYKE